RRSHTEHLLTAVAPPFAFGQQATDKALNAILIVVLFVIMVPLGCTMEIAKITTHLRKLKGVVIAVMVQYSVMPLTASVLGKLVQLGATESLAILICGCCPGGNLSNIFSLSLRGDMNLRTQDIPCTTLVIKIFAQREVLHLFQTNDIFVGSLLPHSPLLASALLHVLLLRAAGMVVLLLSSAPIIALSVASVGSGIMVIFSPSLLGSSALMPFIGFLLGYVLSAVFKLNDWHVPPLRPPSLLCRRLVCMETGCQNVQLCLTILKVAFTPESISPHTSSHCSTCCSRETSWKELILLFRIWDIIKKPNSK
ncbi:NTCP protein, partial [Syrrhaptes paradoxus]|nr:NTCP protein [Syrrhaptes paradoxus]